MIPTFQRLNLDATWHAALGPGVVFDPWLVGSEVDGVPAFHEAWHTGPVVPPDAVPEHGLVVISQPFADHCHPRTLQAMRSEAPLAVVPSAARAVRRALPGRPVHVLPRWGEAPLEVAGLRAWRLTPPLWRPPVFHAVVVADAEDRTVVHAPHGLPVETALGIADKLDVVLLACSRVPYRLPWFLGGQQSPGPAAADALLETLEAEAGFAIHDEDKREVGLVARLARSDRTVDAAPQGTRWVRVEDLTARPITRPSSPGTPGS